MSTPQLPYTYLHYLHMGVIRNQRKRGRPKKGHIRRAKFTHKKKCTKSSSLVSPQEKAKPSSPSIRPSIHLSINRTVDPSQLGPKLMRKHAKACVDQRATISTIYKSEFQQNRSERSLEGRGGVVSLISKKLPTACNGTISRVVKKTKEALENGEEYDPSRASFERKYLRKIKEGSFDEHIISCYKENHSYETTANIFNAMLMLKMKNEYIPAEHYIGRTAIYGAIQRMKSKIIRRKRVNQASNSNCYWKQARLNFYSQLAVRFGMEIPEIPEWANIENKDTILDIEKLTDANEMLSIHGIAWWDEIHLFCVIGCNTDEQHVFARNSSGVYDSSGVIEEKELVSLLL